MGSKEPEVRCLDMILKNERTQGDIAKSIQKRIMSMKEKCQDSERPDFIFVSDNTILGLEHCLVDSCYNEQKGSFSRQKETDIQQTVDAYAKDNDLDKSAKNISQIVCNSFNATYRFDYNVFIKRFEEICLKHNQKCNEGTEKYPSYKNRLRSFKKSNSIVGCIVEIPVSDNKNTYIITKSNRYYKQRIKNIPFTKDIIKIIRKMDGFDFVIICAYSKKFSAITYFDMKNIDDSIKQQNIKICDAFDYEGKIKVKDMSVTKNDNGYEYEYVCEPEKMN